MTIASLKKRIDGRFTRLERRTNHRFDAIDAQFDAVDARMRVGFESIHAKLDALFRDLDDKYQFERHGLSNVGGSTSCLRLPTFRRIVAKPAGG